MDKVVKSKKDLFNFIILEHHDHSYPKLLKRHKKLSTLEMVHGWKVNLYQSHIHPLTGREDKMIKRIKAAVHPSTDTESAFWVNVEGITFCHAGDHVQW